MTTKQVLHEFTLPAAVGMADYPYRVVIDSKDYVYVERLLTQNHHLEGFPNEERDWEGAGIFQQSWDDEMLATIVKLHKANEAMRSSFRDCVETEMWTRANPLVEKLKLYEKALDDVFHILNGESRNKVDEAIYTVLAVIEPEEFAKYYPDTKIVRDTLREELAEAKAVLERIADMTYNNKWRNPGTPSPFHLSHASNAAKYFLDKAGK